MTNKHMAPEPPETFQDRFRDAIAPRSLLLGVGVLILQFGFILSYLGAFHHPVAHHIPVAVVAPGAAGQQITSQLNSLAGQPIAATTADNENIARQKLFADQTSAIYIPDLTATTDTVIIASGGGTSIATAVQEIFTDIAESQHRTIEVTDAVPLQPGDGRGLSGFYLVIGWAVGGYLFAAILGVAKGSRPATFPRALWRLGATVPYALASGLGGALIAGPLLGALTGHFWAITGVGTLVTLSAATVTMAFQTLLGVVGIGLTVVVFVILGNPSAGGAYQPALLPPFWRAISTALPNGAGTDALRRITYFNAHGAITALVILIVWILAGVLTTLTGSALLNRPSSRAAKPRSPSATAPEHD